MRLLSILSTICVLYSAAPAANTTAASVSATSDAPVQTISAIMKEFSPTSEIDRLAQCITNHDANFNDTDKKLKIAQQELNALIKKDKDHSLQALRHRTKEVREQARQKESTIKELRTKRDEKVAQTDELRVKRDEHAAQLAELRTKREENAARLAELRTKREENAARLAELRTKRDATTVQQRELQAQIDTKLAQPNALRMHRDEQDDDSEAMAMPAAAGVHPPIAIDPERAALCEKYKNLNDDEISKMLDLNNKIQKLRQQKEKASSLLQKLLLTERVIKQRMGTASIPEQPVKQRKARAKAATPQETYMSMTETDVLQMLADRKEDLVRKAALRDLKRQDDAASKAKRETKSTERKPSSSTSPVPALSYLAFSSTAEKVMSKMEKNEKLAAHAVIESLKYFDFSRSRGKMQGITCHVNENETPIWHADYYGSTARIFYTYAHNALIILQLGQHDLDKKNTHITLTSTL